jgi:PIN domain nuclease of toxin-antitoxin system
MKILLDTQIFLWYVHADSKLPLSVLTQLRDASNEMYLSVVCAWEIGVKYHLGKLPLPELPAIYVPKARQLHGILSLTLDEASIGRLHSLPSHHRDPFDRMLICQAIEYGMQLATVDFVIRQYPVQVL